MTKAMESLMEMLSVDDRGQNQNKECNEPQIKNPIFRKPRQQGHPPPQILQRGQSSINDQVRPPFQENQVDDNDFPQQAEEHINHVGDKEAKVCVTKEKQDKFASEINDSQSQEAYNDYQKGYQNAMV